jgi:hypothetical protein
MSKKSRSLKMQEWAMVVWDLEENYFHILDDCLGDGFVIAKRDQTMYRFLFENNEVDVSCVIKDFDRWSNSVVRTAKIDKFMRKLPYG